MLCISPAGWQVRNNVLIAERGAGLRDNLSDDCRMKKVIVALALSAVAFGASAAQLITKEEVKHFKLTKVGPISVGPSGGEFSSPSDLHDQLSKLADEKGGKYYVITAAREHGPNFEATAEVYK